MSGATGREATLTAGLQANLSTAAAGTLYGLGFHQFTLDQSDGLQGGDLLGVGYANPYQESEAESVLPRAAGDIVVPTDFNQLLFWLTLMFGAPTTNGDDDPDFVHTFSGTPALPSATLEAVLPDGQYKSALGVMANTMTLDLAKADGFHRITFGCLARQVDLIKSDNPSPGLTTPRLTHASRTALGPALDPSARLPGFGAQVKINNTIAGDLSGGQLTISNSLTPYDGLDGTAYPTEMRRGIQTIRLTPSLRFRRTKTDNSILNLFQGAAGTPFTCGVLLRLADNKSLEFSFGQVKAEKRTPPITGPGDIEFNNVSLVPYQTSGAGAFSAVLKNQVEEL